MKKIIFLSICICLLILGLYLRGNEVPEGTSYSQPCVFVNDAVYFYDMDISMRAYQFIPSENLSVVGETVEVNYYPEKHGEAVWKSDCEIIYDKVNDCVYIYDELAFMSAEKEKEGYAMFQKLGE